MKKYYDAPQAEMALLTSADVITASVLNTSENGNGDWYDLTDFFA